MVMNSGKMFNVVICMVSNSEESFYLGQWEIADKGQNNWVSRTRGLFEKIHIEYQVDGTLNVKELQGTI